jgi:phosphonoacetate hydrolase
MAQERQRVVVGMIDGFDVDYLSVSDMPHTKVMAADGVYREVTAVCPTVTNVNNVSIASCCWPEVHGITGNSYLDDAGVVQYMEAAALRRAPTIMERAAAQGVATALITCKKKTAMLMGQGPVLTVVAETPTAEEVKRYGPAPAIYSADINLWLWTVAADILESRPDIRLLYVHTTDFPMHMWAPDQARSLDHMARLDRAIAQASAAAPDAAFLVTADHGMNGKRRAWDLKTACAEAGAPLRTAFSVERDKYPRHHRNLGGCAYVWLNTPEDEAGVARAIGGLEGVELVLPRPEAAARFHLYPARLGDLVVLGDAVTVFGDLAGPSQELLADGYRSHGSLHESTVPLIVWNYRGALALEGDGSDAFRHNFHVTRPLITSWLGA